MNAVTTDSVAVGKVTEMHSFCAICKWEFSKMTQKTGQVKMYVHQLSKLGSQ